MKTYQEIEHALATLIADVARRAIDGGTIMGMQEAGQFMEMNCADLDLPGLHSNNYGKTKCPDAYRLDLSPHEWTWTDAEQVEMARAIRAYDRDIVKAAPLLRELMKHSKRSCHTERLATQILQILGLAK